MMKEEKTQCLYCNSDNMCQAINCTNCGMPLAKIHPNSRGQLQRRFKWSFIAIALFCLIMMAYLPRFLF